MLCQHWKWVGLMRQLRSNLAQPYAGNSQSLPTSLKSASIGEFSASEGEVG
jgi:6,7-dimethyl-8-ribityllumazine synthase